MTDCYNNIVGLSDSDCDCFDEGRPEDYNTSLSGLFISDLEPLKQIKGLEQCDKNLWEVMQIARKNAILSFISDTNALLLENYSFQRSPYYGTIGQTKGKAYRSISELYAGVRIYPSRIVSGEMVIKGITCSFEDQGSITLQIYNNFDEKLEEISLETLAGKPKVNNVDISLPLFDPRGQLEYYLVYQTSNRPQDNQINCGCGSFVPSFHRDFPYFNRKHTKLNGWANYIMIGGMLTDDITSFDLGDTANNYLNGLALDCEFKCKVHEVLCKDDLDFEANPLALSMAHCIRYQAAVNMAESMLRSGDPNIQTLINAEMLAEASDEWKGRYEELVLYIVNNVEDNDCLCEKNVFGLTGSGVFS